MRHARLLVLAAVGCAHQVTADPVPASIEDFAPAPLQPPIAWPLPAAPEDIVVNMPLTAQTTIDSVAHYLAARIPDKPRLVKALHDYVVLHVRYDVDTFARVEADRPSPSDIARRSVVAKLDDYAVLHPYGGDVPDQSPDAVFARRTAVCEGFASLLQALGRAAGVEVEVVVGLVRGTTYPHAWNAARIDGRWYLIDATWDLPDEPGDRSSISSFYLFMPPEQFATSHYPMQRRWQLLAKPIAFDAFLRHADDAPMWMTRDRESKPRFLRPPELR